MVEIETTALPVARDLNQNRVEARMRYYDSQTQAMQRVERLKDEAGYWPGVIGPDRDGHYRLSYDPGLAAAREPATIGVMPEPTRDRDPPQHRSSGRDHPASQPESEASPPEADLDQIEAAAWLQDDLQEGPEAEDSGLARLAQAELEAELEAGLPAEADWGL
jgi:hypothetical protein